MDTKIQLGTFVFQDLEIPEKINFGGTQQLVQHDLIGGNRVIDSLGQSDIDISWSGLMTGSTALPRAQQLNQLRAAGQQLNLTWFSLNYVVVIQNFVSYTERFYQVGYEIVLRVIKDGSNPIASQNLVGFSEAVTGDFNTANTIASGLAITALNSAMTSLNTAISAVSTFSNATPATIATVQTPLSSAINAVDAAITPISARLFGTNNIPGFVPAEDAAAQQADQYSYYQLYTMQYYLQRIQGNLSLINSPPNGTTVTANNTNLFALAAQSYGDAWQWPVIANANGMTDPMITTQTNIFIPPWNQQDTGGIL